MRSARCLPMLRNAAASGACRQRLAQPTLTCGALPYTSNDDLNS